MIRHPSVFATSILAAMTLVTSAARAGEVPDFLAAAIADTNRPEADTKRDMDRKPAQTLLFTGIKSGDRIAELLPGGGYFTRIFSKAVGTGGHVFALVPARSPNAPADMPDFAARVKAIAADPQYSNVSVVVEPFSQLKVPELVDLVWTSQNYHDLHNLPGLDVAVFNQMIFEALKPGGIYLVLDHTAEPGSGIRDTSTLHRIDPQTVKKEVLDAGFVFVGSSDLLSQPGDSRTVKVFEPSVRGKTDQFILKFRKPNKP